MKKAIIIGTSLSGKTTLIKHLRSITNLPISEVDEELTMLNGGVFPLDIEYKHNILFPKVAELILSKSEIIFFTNSDYFSIEQLQEAREKGFKIVQLEVSLDVLKKRNIERQKEGYDNLEQYLKGMVEYQMVIKEQNLVDYIIDGEQPAEKVISELLDILNKK